MSINKVTAVATTSFIGRLKKLRFESHAEKNGSKPCAPLSPCRTRSSTAREWEPHSPPLDDTNNAKPRHEQPAVDNHSCTSSKAFNRSKLGRSSTSHVGNKLMTFVIAIKGWACYESERYVGKPVIGASRNMLSSYCYTIMSIAVLHLYRPESVLDFYFAFFDYYSSFDWQSKILTVKGGIDFADKSACPPTPPATKVTGVVNGRGAKRASSATDKDACSNFADDDSGKSFSDEIDDLLYTFKDFGRRTKTGNMWIHVDGANVQDPLDFGNNLGKHTTRENIDLTSMAFKMAREHMLMLNQWGSSRGSTEGVDESRSFWDIAKRTSKLSFLWPEELLGSSDECDGKALQRSKRNFESLEKARIPSKKMSPKSASSKSPVNGCSPVITSKLSLATTSKSIPVGDSLCALCYNRKSGFECGPDDPSGEDRHIKDRHWFIFSFFSNSVRLIVKAQTNYLTSPSGAYATGDHKVSLSGSGLFLPVASSKRSSSGRLSPPRNKVTRKLTNTSDGLGLRIDTKLPADFSHLNVSPSLSEYSASPTTPCSPSIQMKGIEARISSSTLPVSLRVVSHVCRLAGFPDVIRESDLLLDHDANGAGAHGSHYNGKKSRRKNHREWDEWTENSSIGTVDTLEESFENFNLDLYPAINDVGLKLRRNTSADLEEFSITDDREVTSVSERSELHGYENDAEIQVNEESTNRTTCKAARNSPKCDIKLSFENYKGRRDSADTVPSLAGDKQIEPTKTTPDRSWSNTLGSKLREKKDVVEEELTYGDTKIRARLIKQDFHDIVDPTLKKKNSGKPQDSADQSEESKSGGGWGFSDKEKRIMWVVIINNSTYNITLEHGTLSGKKRLTINGSLLAVKGNNFVDFGGKFKFKISHIDMVVSVESCMTGTFKYKLMIAGMKNALLRTST